jgi:hypothetical protein
MLHYVSGEAQGLFSHCHDCLGPTCHREQLFKDEQFSYRIKKLQISTVTIQRQNVQCKKDLKSDIKCHRDQMYRDQKSWIK